MNIQDEIISTIWCAKRNLVMLDDSIHYCCKYDLTIQCNKMTISRKENYSSNVVFFHSTIIFQVVFRQLKSMHVESFSIIIIIIFLHQQCICSLLSLSSSINKKSYICDHLSPSNMIVLLLLQKKKLHSFFFFIII